LAKKIDSIAWAAGLFEGEGSCYLTQAGNRQPRVSLEMTDEDAVRRFQRAIGKGNVRAYSSAPPRKNRWQWSVQSKDDVLSVLGLLWPYLGERRLEAATEVIERAAKLNDGDGFCHRGHDLTDLRHLYVHRKTGKRHCRTCRSASSERRRVS
jgi:hypothetical protein